MEIEFKLCNKNYTALFFFNHAARAKDPTAEISLSASSLLFNLQKRC